MINDLEQTNDSSLADDEIASLMKTLASNQYKGNPAFPKKVIQPFKPLSLPEIASKTDDNKFSDTSESEKTPEKPNNQPQTNESTETNDTNDLSNDKVPIEDQKNETSEHELSQLSEDDSKDKNLEPLPEEILEQNQVPDDKQELWDQTEATTIGVPIKEKLYTENEKEEAYRKGFDVAKKEFEAEQAFQQDKALRTLNDIIEKAKAKIDIDTNLLEKQIKEEILSISTERVGASIKEIPEKFVKKIENLVKAIKQKGEMRILKLNPEDFNEVSSLLKDSEDLANLVINPDQTLEHGDLIVELGGVSLEDRISDRYASNDMKGTRNFALTGLKTPPNNQKPQVSPPKIDSDLVVDSEKSSKHLEPDETTTKTEDETIGKGDPVSANQTDSADPTPLDKSDSEEKEKLHLGDSTNEEPSVTKDEVTEDKN